MEQHAPTPVRLRQLLAAVLAAAALIWLMTGLFAPLTLGILIAVLLSPAAESLCRRTGCSRRVAAVGVVFLFYLLLGLVVAAGLIWAANRGTTLLRQLPQLWNSVLGHLLPQLESLFSSHLPLAAWGTATLEHTLSGWISRISGRVAALAARWLSRLPALLLGSVFTVLLSFYAAADYPRLCALLRRRISPEKIAVLKKLLRFAGRVLLRMLRTWVILSAMLLMILTVGLWLLRVPHPLSAAGLITLFDLLPLIGSGLILLPWGFWELCQGRTALGVGLWLLFALAELLRTLLEPRLLGAGAGLPPLAMTASLFAGLRLGGAMGAFLLPAAVLLLWEVRQADPSLE